MAKIHGGGCHVASERVNTKNGGISLANFGGLSGGCSRRTHIWLLLFFCHIIFVEWAKLAVVLCTHNLVMGYKGCAQRSKDHCLIREIEDRT